MVLPISLDPCEDLNALINQKTGDLEQKGVWLRSYIENLRQEIRDFADIPSTQEALDNAIAAASVNDINAGTTAITQIRNFTGTCLDHVYNQARKYALEIDGFITDALDDITSFITLPEFDMLSALRAARTALGVTGIAALLDELDELLGCLADQGSELGVCLSLLDNFNDRIDDVLRYTGLTSEGNLNLDHFVDHFNLDIDSTALSNLSALDFKVDDLTTEALANVKKAIPTTVNPPTRY